LSTQQPRDGIRPPGDRPEPSEPAAPVSPPAAAAAPSAIAAKEKPAQPPVPPRPRWNWQLVTFLWITSLLFLSLYELLWAFFRFFSGTGATSP